MKKTKKFVVSKGGKFLKVVEGLSNWTIKKAEATRFINERKAVDRLQSSDIDGATLIPTYE